MPQIPVKQKSPAPWRGLDDNIALALVGAKSQARELSDKPSENAFCRVAPSVRFRDLAMLAARVFFLASVVKVRTCSVVQVRCVDLW